MLLAVMLWLSVVVNWIFTSGGVDVCAQSLFVDYRCVNVSVRVLNFRSWSQPRNCFNSEIFPMYGMYVYTLLDFSMICLQSTKHDHIIFS